MPRPKVLVVVGTRPEVIKTAPVVWALQASNKVRTVLLGTAQHRGLMDQMLKTFKLSLDHDLDLMRHGQSPEQVFLRVNRSLTPILRKEKPSMLLVQGDTTSAMASAYTAFAMGIPVGHIEAGLRSDDFSQPCPEELNRFLIDWMADLHFAPTTLSRRNLLKEGIPKEGIHVTGNTVVDALHWLLEQPHIWKDKRAERFTKSMGRKVLLTVHRRESFGKPHEDIFKAVRSLIDKHKDLQVLAPVHPNPMVRKSAAKRLRHERITLTEPLDYPDLIHAARSCSLIMSDSGGISEEAPTLGVPVVILRELCDRPEVLRPGVASLSGTSRRAVARHAERFLRRGKRTAGSNPCGDGRAAVRIARLAARHLHC